MEDISKEVTKIPSAEEKKEESPFIKSLEALSSEEEKVRKTLDFMKEALSQKGKPNFREFWEARNFCLSLFKRSLNPLFRKNSKNECQALSSECLRLKEMLEEHSSFAVEQIELAISSLEQDLENYSSSLKQFPEPKFSKLCQKWIQKDPAFLILHKELLFLNTFADRIHSLRKELIKREMRIRQKNLFFKRLSEMGDRIFPKKKELIQKVSEEFSSEVENFVQKRALEEKPFFVLREEIKGLQGLAKVLFLNSQTFSSLRQKLSTCWEELSLKEKEEKKKFEEKRQEEKLKRNEELSKAQLLTKERQERERKVKEAAEKRQKRLEEVKRKISSLLQEKIEAQEIEKVREEIAKELEAIVLSKEEKKEIALLWRAVEEYLLEEKEKSLKALPKGEELLEKWKEILRSRKELREEVKKEIEEYRKRLGSSGFDFAQAMKIREQMDLEKLKLEVIDKAIEEIEDMLVEWD